MLSETRAAYNGRRGREGLQERAMSIGASSSMQPTLCKLFLAKANGHSDKYTPLCYHVTIDNESLHIIIYNK